MSAPDASQPNLRAHEALLAVAVAAARSAGALVRERAADAARLEWRVKSTADFVSDVDTAAEACVRDVVARELPGAVIIGEEGSPDVALGDAPTFVVDPLDGTTNFLHGYPWYAVSVAVFERRAPVAAAVLNVPTGELFTAAAGGGAWRDGQRLHVSAIADPARALVGTGFPFKHLAWLERYQRQFAAVTRATAGIRRAGAAALDLADVACGRFDAFWELSLMPWDFAAGILLIREAGGIVTDLSGHSPPLAPSGIVAGNPAMHGWMMELLRKSAP